MKDVTHTTRGKLCILWQGRKAPEPGPGIVQKYYQTQYYPALAADARRLHEAFRLSHRFPLFSYGTYFSALVRLRGAFSGLAIADMAPIERRIDEAHAVYISREERDMDFLCRGVLLDAHHASSSVQDDTYLDRRLNGIAADTSYGVKDMDGRLQNPERLGELYLATLKGQDAVDKLITQTWASANFQVYMNEISHKAQAVMQAMDLDRRAQLAESEHRTRPAIDGADAAMRQGRMMMNARPRALQRA